VGGVALFATANTALIALIAASRVLYGMASGGDAPDQLGSILPGRRTPWLASLIVGCGALLLLPLGRVEVIGSVASLAALLGFVVVNACLVRLRFKQPTADRPFHVPLKIGRWPVLPVAGALLAGLLMTQFEPQAYLVILLVLLAGLLVHAVRR
jgi:amino acid transporter